ncbi:2-hydroxyacyl-CoA dehydratase family protein [Clostridium sp. UBA1056]|uniref:2-hydroxyacyl-CoA dehydratase family protein n=1 Tax=unclassified Clostridium TaxID=2614128 RepID=UPI0032171F43
MWYIYSATFISFSLQFANQDYDVLLYDFHANKNRRGEHIADLLKKSGADGLILFMQKLCDHEEMEYPYLKQALDKADVPHIKLGIDQQMMGFGQACTAIQAFVDMMEFV